jgi:hypothetical protein
MGPDQKRTWLSAIILRCPFASALDTCPVGKIRQLDVGGRMAFVEQIRPSHVERILNHHKICLLVREAVEEGPGLFEGAAAAWKPRSCPAKMRHLRWAVSGDGGRS